MSDWSGSGYDAEVTKSDGLFFRLKDKGQTARLRLVSPPHRYEDVLPDGKMVRKCAWIAILKEMVSGKPNLRAVVFQASPMVYGAVKDLAESEDWGDPTQYDVQVTRTEEQGKYYTVVPIPKPMGPITEEQAAMVAEKNIDLAKVCAPKAKQTKAEEDEEYDPFGDE